MTTYALPRRRGLLARLIGEADDFTSWLLFGAETWLIATMKGVPLFAFVYWLLTYVPNSIYYGVTQFIPFLEFSAEVGYLVANGVAWTNVVLIVIAGFVVQAARGRRGPGWTLVRLFTLANYLFVVLLLIPYFVFNVAGGAFITPTGPRLPLIALGLGAVTAGGGATGLAYLYYEFRRYARREAQAAAAASRAAG